jgi:hypothetical protein
MPRITLICFSACLGLALLGGCSSNRDRMLDQAFGFNCTAADSTVGGWICSQNDAPVGQISRYCYETLGTVNCFDRPDPDRQNQPQGSSGF